jgi:predicted RNase H-like nuclease (RuvC/YqgF family)
MRHSSKPPAVGQK